MDEIVLIETKVYENSSVCLSIHEQKSGQQDDDVDDDDDDHHHPCEGKSFKRKFLKLVEKVFFFFLILSIKCFFSFFLNMHMSEHTSFCDKSKMCSLFVRRNIETHVSRNSIPAMTSRKNSELSQRSS